MSVAAAQNVNRVLAEAKAELLQDDGDIHTTMRKLDEADTAAATVARNEHSPDDAGKDCGKTGRVGCSSQEELMKHDPRFL